MEKSCIDRVKLINKTKSFGPIVQTLKDVKFIGYKWAFVPKHNENNEIIRYKLLRLVA